MDRNLLQVALLAFIAFAAAADKDFEEGDLFIRARGQSGKIFLGRKTKDVKGNIEREGFAVEVKEIKEIDATSSPEKIVNKPVMTLASENFTVSPLDRNALFKGVKAATVTLTAKLKNSGATLTLTIIIFQESGNITYGDESYEVQKDIVKFLVEIENYIFCNGSAVGFCRNNDTGVYLDITIAMRNKNGDKGVKESEADRKKRQGPPPPGVKQKGVRCMEKKERGRCPEFRYIGKDKTAASNVTIVDGKYVYMPEGYPKFKDQGGRVLITFRGSRFNKSVVFDPLLELEEGDGDGDDTDHATSIQLNVFMFVAILAALLM